MTGRKSCALQVSLVVPYKSFLRLCMGQREVLAVHDFSILLWASSLKLPVYSKLALSLSILSL